MRVRGGKGDRKEVMKIRIVEVTNRRREKLQEENNLDSILSVDVTFYTWVSY